MKLNFFDNLLSAVFPEKLTCDICGRETFDKNNLCADCVKTVTFNDKNSCPVCGRRTKVSQLCIECKAQAPIFAKAVSAMSFKDGGAKLIHKFKNGGAYLKEYFADLLYPKCKEFDGVQCICYIPMTDKKKFARTYNQAELLAKALGKRLDVAVIDGALEKVKDSEEQKTLSKREREENLVGCFKADKQAVSGKVVLLIDDVMTTGATSDAATQALLKAGAKKVYFATVASVEYMKLL